MIALMMCIMMLALAGCKSGGVESGGSESPESKSESSETARQEPLRVLMDVEFDTMVGPPLREYLNNFQVETLKGGKTRAKSFEKVIEELGGQRT